jgi:tetratricopeptide (TPR) repeat protein
MAGDTSTKRNLLGAIAGLRRAVAASDPARTVASARAVLDQDPCNVAALLALARALDAQGDGIAAALVWRKLLEADHPKVSHFLFAVRSAEACGDRPAALALSRQGLRSFPRDLPLLLAAAKNALALNRHRAAIIYLARYMGVDPAAGLRLISESYRKGRLTQTVCCYIALLRQSPVPKAAAAWGVKLREDIDRAGGTTAQDLATAARLLRQANGPA